MQRLVQCWSNASYVHLQVSGYAQFNKIYLFTLMLTNHAFRLCNGYGSTFKHKGIGKEEQTMFKNYTHTATQKKKVLNYYC